MQVTQRICKLNKEYQATQREGPASCACASRRVTRRLEYAHDAGQNMKIHPIGTCFVGRPLKQQF